MIIAIDPGPTESAYILWDGEIREHAKIANDDLLQHLHGYAEHCVIEQIRGFGITAGNEVLDTCIWTGRFMQEFGAHATTLVPRKTVVTHLCGHAKAGDKDVREAICYRYGGTEKAIGRVCKSKKINAPGPLYGIAGDCWSALAVALWAHDTQAARVAGKTA